MEEVNYTGLNIPDTPLLSDHETKRLIKEAQGGNQQAKDKLVHHNLRLVISITRRFRGRGRDGEDLFQIGCIGLLKAIENFDLSYDVRFSTYAVPRIIGEIKQFLRRDGPISVGRTLQDLAAKAMATQQELTNQLGRPPTITELSANLGVDKEDVVAALTSVQQPASLHDVIKDDGGQPIHLEDLLPAGESRDEETESIALWDVVKQLPPREQQIIVMRFIQEKTQSEVAAHLGLSQAQISRLEKAILNHLKNLLL